MADQPRPLDEIRKEIDHLDSELVRLLSRRAELAQEVGYIKGIDHKPFFTPERERIIYDKLEQVNPGPLRNEQLIGIYREIISAARALEKPLVCAFWGPIGTFTHQAAAKVFGGSTTFLAQESIHDIFMAVEHGEADYGVVPVENSAAGVVPETLDMFPRTRVKICAEVYVPIHHYLVSVADSLDRIKRVYAGPQPATQCKQWLRKSLPQAEIIEVVPTAKAAERALQNPQSAAIANKLAAETVGIPILMEHIEDNPDNRTRFLVIGYNEPAKTGKDKTSLMFSVRNKPGELYRALGAFVEEGVNLVMIESRPAPRVSFEYLFYCDAMGHRSDEPLQRALAKLEGAALDTTILGSYPFQDPLHY